MSTYPTTPNIQMKRFLSPLVALTAGSAVVLGTHPALAHGTAGGGALSGLTHPLLGLDHLLMLMAVGTAASFISSQLLLWALGGAVIGAVLGFTGFTVTSAVYGQIPTPLDPDPVLCH